MYWAGAEESENAKGVVALFIVGENIKYIMNEKWINEWLIKLEIKEVKVTKGFTVIVTYRPNKEAKKEEKDR